MLSIGAALEATVYALKIWSINAYYNLICRKDIDTQTLEAERDRLRDLGDPASQLAADRVQQRILARSGVYIPPPPFNPESASGAPAGSGGTDKHG